MPFNSSSWKRRWGLRRWPLWSAAALAIALAAWVFPRRIERMVAIDGQNRWAVDRAAGPREIAWQPPDELSGLAPPHDPPYEASHPHLADGGAMLYLTVREAAGDADIYRSRFIDGRWQPAAAMIEWNTPWDEQGVAVSADGRELYLASDRRGGQGGFDLYVCRRLASGWSLPENLGPHINTAADEYEPAPTPDGLQLFFASDRADDRSLFEIYSARRAARGKRWANVELNSQTSFAGANQRSPNVSANGSLLYFASDRPARAGEPRNFDLYRIALAEPGRRPENLGRSVNSSADEMQPSVSSEGFAILFARGPTSAGAPATIVRSAAAEVRRVTGWDTSRWQALKAVWHKAFLATALLLGLAAAVYGSRGWLRQSASMARFLAASLFVHALVLWLMLIVPLSQEIVERVEEIRVSEGTAELFDDDTRQSHLAGKAAYEKVADLQGAEPVAAPVVRSVTAPQNFPLRGDSPALPAELARRLPADRLIFAPPLRPATATARDIDRAAADVARLAEIEPLAVPPPERVEMPAEPALVRAVELAREAPAPIALEPEASDSPSMLAAELRRMTIAAQRPGPADSPSAATATPRKVEFARNEPRSTPIAALTDEQPASTQAVATPQEAPLPAPVIELAATAAAPLEMSNKTPNEPEGPRRPRDLKLVLGALAERAVEAAPSVSPLATQLQRPAARAAPVAYAEDNVGMQAMFSLRQGDLRREFIDLVGGNEQSEAAVRRGLQWLAEHQHADGRWSLHQLDPPEKKLPATSGAGSVQSDTAATGLGLLPFLGAGHTHLSGEHQGVVARAVQWLVEHQKPNGDLFSDPPSNAYMYSHAIAAIALSESYGLSQDAKLRDPAQRALDFIVAAQHAGGGWRYRPGEPGDTSVVGWQIMALKSGEMAGLNAPQAALDAAAKWLASAAGSGAALGTFGYQGPGASPAMSAEGLLCSQFLGSRRNDPALKAGAEYLLKNLPQPGGESSYYWYYATQVMYHMQGPYWAAWNERLRDMLVAAQIKDGPPAGSWEPRDAWEQQGGRLYATSLRLLMLEVYYRHLPLYGALE
ncbi:MAG TPA: hypothetical protein VN699_13580 [Pirellulales bacterium]|nr:hypothetical protein [Pirellulales bacterium]